MNKKWYILIAALCGYFVYASIVLAIFIPKINTALHTEPTTSVAPQVATDTQLQQKPSADELYKLVNAERTKRGIKPLKLDKLLNKSAQLKADELEREGLDDTPHVNDSGKHGYSYTVDVGVKCSYSGENLLTGSSGFTSKESVNSWMHSKKHKAAILASRYDSVGYFVSDNFVVQHFCDKS